MVRAVRAIWRFLMDRIRGPRRNWPTHIGVDEGFAEGSKSAVVGMAFDPQNKKYHVFYAKECAGRDAVDGLVAEAEEAARKWKKEKSDGASG